VEKQRAMQSKPGIPLKIEKILGAMQDDGKKEQERQINKPRTSKENGKRTPCRISRLAGNPKRQRGHTEMRERGWDP